MVILHTTFGAIKIELNHEKAPNTAANFEKLVESGFYSNVIFHRVIDDFMIQGGGLTPSMREKPGQDPIENEADNGLSNTVGTIAMARTMDPHSASTQFFINVNDNKFLDHTAKTMDGWGYCVFGEVVAGMDVVNRIKSIGTTIKSGYHDVPVEEIIIQRAELVEASEEGADESGE